MSHLKSRLAAAGPPTVAGRARIRAAAAGGTGAELDLTAAHWQWDRAADSELRPGWLGIMVAPPTRTVVMISFKKPAGSAAAAQEPVTGGTQVNLRGPCQ
jgi:hypothetical protein